jgi:hypothetical protein
MSVFADPDLPEEPDVEKRRELRRIEERAETARRLREQRCRKPQPPLLNDDDAAAQEPPVKNGHDTSPPPIIRVLAGHRHKAADQGLAAAYAAGIRFYRRDRGLVRVCLIKAKNTSGEIILVPGIMPITAAMLCRRLDTPPTGRR